MKKKDYQKRALTLQRFIEICEKFPKLPLAEIMGTLMSPIGEKIHPFKWDDNELMGKLESLEVILEEDYKLEFIQEYDPKD